MRTYDEYLFEFERWVGGSKERKEQVRAELEEHLDGAQQAGELDAALKRLGDPRNAARDFSSGHRLRPAALPRRVLAAALDFAIALGLGAGGLASGTWAATSRENALFPEDLSLEVSGETWYLTAFTSLGVLLLVLACLWWILILPLLEWRTGRTLGKAVLGLRVIAEDGTAPSFGQIVVRRLTLVFSGPLQLFDWALVFFNPKRQRAFEILAKTMVVRDGPREGGVS